MSNVFWVGLRCSHLVEPERWVVSASFSDKGGHMQCMVAVGNAIECLVPKNNNSGRLYIEGIDIGTNKQVLAYRKLLG
jgi:hypothetical protein